MRKGRIFWIRQNLAFSQEDSSAVRLVSEEECRENDPPLTIPVFHFPELQKPSKKKKRFRLSEFIIKTYSDLRRKQQEIDDATYVEQGPGRKRANPHRTTNQLQEFIWSHFYEGLERMCLDQKMRPDAFSIKFIRFATKLPYVLIRNCSSISIYKKPEMESYIFSFLESFMSFTSLTHYHECNIVESFCEY